MTLGEKLRSVRKDRGYTLNEVEDHTGITQSYLSKIERNLKTNPSLDILKTLASFYGIDIQWLMFEQSSPSSPSTRRIKDEIVELLDLVEEKELSKVLGILKVFVQGGETHE